MGGRRQSNVAQVDISYSRTSSPLLTSKLLTILPYTVLRVIAFLESARVGIRVSRRGDEEIFTRHSRSLHQGELYLVMPYEQTKEGFTRAQHAGSFDGLLSVCPDGTRPSSHSGYKYDEKDNQ
mgnify:CR=1 FL=1